MKEEENHKKNIETKNVFFKEPNKAFEEECRRWMGMRAMNH